MPIPQTGHPAPDFQLQDQNGNDVKLSQLRGKNVVLYFYPKDNTPASTREACDFRDEHSALAKAYCTTRMREVVGWARELLAGNGIVLDYDIGRFVADAEALYSYEGTREINTLIVGRAVTGESAFV